MPPHRKTRVRRERTELTLSDTTRMELAALRERVLRLETTLGQLTDTIAADLASRAEEVQPVEYIELEFYVNEHGTLQLRDRNDKRPVRYLDYLHITPFVEEEFQIAECKILVDPRAYMNSTPIVRGDD